MELPYDDANKMIFVDNVGGLGFSMPADKSNLRKTPDTEKKNDTTAENNRFRHGDADMA